MQCNPQATRIAACMRRVYETLCPYERTYERENINAVLRLVQESEIQAFIRTIARAMLELTTTLTTKGSRNSTTNCSTTRRRRRSSA